MFGIRAIAVSLSACRSLVGQNLGQMYVPGWRTRMSLR